MLLRVVYRILISFFFLSKLIVFSAPHMTVWTAKASNNAFPHLGLKFSVAAAIRDLTSLQILHVCHSLYFLMARFERVPLPRPFDVLLSVFDCNHDFSAAFECHFLRSSLSSVFFLDPRLLAFSLRNWENCSIAAWQCRFSGWGGSGLSGWHSETLMLVADCRQVSIVFGNQRRPVRRVRQLSERKRQSRRWTWLEIDSPIRQTLLGGDSENIY